jgi:hypothetical protein
MKNIVALVLIIFTLLGCSAGDLQIVKFGPEKIKAGETFNVQADGESYLLIEAPNITETSKVNVDGNFLKFNIYPGKGANGPIPKSITTVVGAHKVYLFDPASNKKSNEVDFIVN